MVFRGLLEQAVTLFHGDPGIPADFSFQLQNLSQVATLPLGVEASGAIAGNGQVVYRVHLDSGQRIRVDGLGPLSDQVNIAIANSGGRLLYNANVGSDSALSRHSPVDRAGNE